MKTKRTAAILGVAALTIFAGSAGYAGGSQAAPPPEVRIETIVEHKTRTVRVEVVPQACLDVIDRARDGFGIFVEYTSVMGDFLGAAADSNLYEMSRHGERVTPLIAKMHDLGPQFKTAAEECEAVDGIF